LFFFGSAQRASCSKPTRRAGHPPCEVSPRLNGKLTWQPTTNDNITAHVQ
jgi:hypothetical protein